MKQLKQEKREKGGKTIKAVLVQKSHATLSNILLLLLLLHRVHIQHTYKLFTTINITLGYTCNSAYIATYFYYYVLLRVFISPLVLLLSFWHMSS